MKIVVLNGSPKGLKSVTMQYVGYIQKKYPEHEFKILNIAHDINKIEKNETEFKKVIEEIRTSDGILWAFPLYYMVVISQYMRFIEMIFERKEENAFKDKYCSSLTTSIKFFDHTAHNYIRAISDDLDMKYISSFSANGHELKNENHRKSLLSFTECLIDAIKEKKSVIKLHSKVDRNNYIYSAKTNNNKISTDSKNVVLLTDSDNSDSNLEKMIQRFSQSYSQKIDIINLNEINMKGGCLGCMHCSFDNKCSWEKSDDYVNFFNSKIVPADIIIFAGSIKYRYLSSLWKSFFDRSFFRNHVPYLKDKQIAFIITGPLSQNINLVQMLEAYSEVHGSNLAGYVTDECSDSESIDLQLESLAHNLIYLSKKNYIRPKTFLGFAGLKVFRDELWAGMKLIFHKDHKYYKNNKLYDFPTKSIKVKLINIFLSPIVKLPFVKTNMQRNMKENMISGLKKIVNNS